jgi:hypothetical protein
MNASLRQRLGHLRWIGGGSGAGKSTVARHIAATHGLRVCSTDDAMAEHARRLPRDESPRLHAFMAMSMDERWLRRSPREMLESFHWFAGEGFALVVDDLLALPREPTIVEGFRLLPRLVAPLLSSPAHAVWLLPTPAFRERVFASRALSTSGFLARTSDPERALANLLERDRLFTEELHAEVARLALPAIAVDGATGEEELARRVATALRVS